MPHGLDGKRREETGTWDYSHRRQKKPGRPALPTEVVKLVVRLAKENASWGYKHIQGALANLGHELSDTSVANILKEHGLEPAPSRRRQTTWKTFIKAHWNVLAAIDFTTIEVWSRKGLVWTFPKVLPLLLLKPLGEFPPPFTRT
jgi:hypothetical protein